MRIAVSGSIATDHLMTYDGRFAEQLLADQLEHLSVSFLVDDLNVRRGGVAANICVGLARLGLRPLLVGAVGHDFGDYGAWLAEQGVDTSAVAVSETRHTARFTGTTDRDQNQIASFYPGAMSEARDIDLGRLADVDLLLISPNDPVAMSRFAAHCRDAKLPFAADPSQQLASLDGDTIRGLVDGAQLLFGNAYEAVMLERKTGWSAAEVADRVETRVITRGADGVVVFQRGEPELGVPVVPAEQVADPTGVGDAFRAGFLAARSWQLSLERCAQLGSLLATWCVETIGPQEYVVDPAQGQDRLRAAYGEDAAAEIVAHLRG